MERITKINDTTVEIETTIVQTRQLSIDDLQKQIEDFQGDIDNATEAFNKQIAYLQAQIDDRNSQIISIKNLGVITEKEAKLAEEALVTPLEESTTTEAVIN